MRSLVKNDIKIVSTHSRAEAAAFFDIFVQFYNISVSTHSRAEAAAPYIK